MKRPNLEPLFFGTNRAILNVQGCKHHEVDSLTFYDLHEDIWDRSIVQNKKQKEKRRKELTRRKQRQIHTDDVVKLYDLHQDIWSRGKKQKRKEDNYYAYLEKYLTKPTPDCVVPVS